MNKEINIKCQKLMLFVSIALSISSCASSSHNLINSSYVQASADGLSLNGEKLEKPFDPSIGCSIKWKN